jgi:hypothetical protein
MVIGMWAKTNFLSVPIHIHVISTVTILGQPIGAMAWLPFVTIFVRFSQIN